MLGWRGDLIRIDNGRCRGRCLWRGPYVWGDAGIGQRIVRRRRGARGHRCRGFGNGGGFALPTSGKVTAVSGSTITVDAVDFQTQKTASKSVTVDSATKYTQSQKAAASALAVGQCVVAQGKADDSGTVAATSIAVSAPVDGSCTTGFGFRGTRPNGGTGSGTGSDANGTVNG